jgi:hypothetical protein
MFSKKRTGTLIGVLKLYLRNPQTRAAAGNLFEKIFLKKFQKDPSKMPLCFKMANTSGIHPQSPLRENAKGAERGVGMTPKNSVKGHHFLPPCHGWAVTDG